MRGLVVEIADQLQNWSEALKNLNTPGSIREYIDKHTGDVSSLMPKAGGTFTGAVTLAGDATTLLQPVPLQQVSALIAAVKPGLQQAEVEALIRAAIAALPEDVDFTETQIKSWIAEQIAAIPAIDLSGLMPKAGGTFTGSVLLNANAAQALEPTPLQQVQALIAAIPAVNLDPLMPKSGGVFTGEVLMSGNAVKPLEPVTLSQMTTAINSIVVPDITPLMQKAGGVFTGAITLAANAANPLEPTTLQQVQAMINAIPAVDLTPLMPKAGGTFTGVVTLAANAANALEAVPLQQVQSLIAAIPAVDLTPLMPKAGGTFTGAVTLSANATKALEPVPLQQVQSLISAIDLTALMPKAGGAFTGTVSLAANAATALEPVPLQQVQSLIGAAKPITYPYDMNFAATTALLPGDILSAFIATREVTIPFALTDSSAKVLGTLAKTKPCKFNFKVNGTVVLSVNFAVNSATGVFTLITPNTNIVIPKGATFVVQADETDYDTAMTFPAISLTGTTPAT